MTGAVQSSFTGTAPVVKSFIGSMRDDRCLEVWFADKVTDETRAWLLDAVNEKALRSAAQAAIDPRPALAAAHSEENEKWKEASKVSEKWSDRSWQAGRVSGLALALQIYDQAHIAADVRAFELRAKTLARQTTTSVLPRSEGQAAECDGGLHSVETLLARVAALICETTCGLTSECKSREAAQALLDKGYLGIAYSAGDCGIEAAAEYLVRTVERKLWTGLRTDGRAKDNGFEPFHTAEFSYAVNGNARQEDYRDVIREIGKLLGASAVSSTDREGK